MFKPTLCHRCVGVSYQLKTRLFQTFHVIISVNYSDICETKKAVHEALVLLRECLLTHRWSEVLQVLNTLATAPRHACEAVYKVSI